MEMPKISSQYIRFGLTLLIIFLVGFLGVLTGFVVFVKPELVATATTTILKTTTTTTTPVTTSTTSTTTTTIPSDPCSPCFEYFNYVGHNNQFLSLRNGPRTVKITKASQTKGGSMSPDFNINYVYPNQLMIFSSSYPEGTKITIEYVDITSGNARLDSATLN